MARDDERLNRASQAPIVGGLPDAPGISAAMRLTPGLGMHLRGLADELLVNDFPGATLSREERELLATSVSAANDCFFCMDSHGAHATAIARRSGSPTPIAIIEDLKVGVADRLDPRMRALRDIARTVARRALDLTLDDVEVARSAGATDGDVQLAVLIAAAFSMYNRMVDGFRARTAPVIEAYDRRASEIAESGYAAPSSLGPQPAAAENRPAGTAAGRRS
ncbi:MAG TPA: carboxymuconolactone decarboxylase family protein [Candidatus Binatus sp.]|nr:carboxymuconolactone decarboxylase family protein [Candidatus Binatus sp.]